MKKIIAVLLSIVLVLALFGCSKQEEPEVTETSATTTEPVTEPVNTANPLTGEADFNSAAVGKRPVALVVENLSPARPQWAIGTSDIIMEGEVEGGISRMLWLYADYTSVPEKVGPMRSARPSYVKFSEMFDAIFVHWGGSHSNGNYTGGYETISADKVDDLDGMDGGELFGRDTTRSVSSEHRGILKGDNLASAIANKGYRTDLDKDRFSELTFNDSTENAGTETADSFRCAFSSRTDTRAFSYSAEDGKYHTNDWKTDVAFENIIILMDETTYITVPYKGSTTTYLNYSFAGGTGYYASNGTAAKITWSVTDGILELKDESGKTLSLNQGKSYIGLASSDNGGSVSYN